MSNFDAVADTYTSTSITQSKASLRTIELLKSVLPINGSVLDIGCGTGKITFEISKMTTGDVLGTDISSKMIAISRQQNKNANLSFRTLAVDDINWVGKFDCIFGNSSFYYIKDRPSCYKKLYASLKEQGHLVVQVSYRDMFSKLFTDALNTVLSNNSDMNEIYRTFNNPIFFYDHADDFCHELKQAGFIIKDIETEDQRTTLPLDGIMMQFESNVFPNLLNEKNYTDHHVNFSGYCEKMRSLIKDELESQLNGDNELTVMMPRMYIVAFKI